ncbi:MAG: aldo/keto reductase [Chloroflexi bacterium]|nr:aldo/keto reductase [Chloroflexota bacterium]
MFTRTLGKSGIKVSAMGLGCWAIGGPLWYSEGTDRLPLWWGKVDDSESIQAIHRALDLGVSFFDTADSYGAGHSERVLGQALVGKRHQVIVATKFGEVFDEETKDWLGYPHPDGVLTPAFIRQSCEASLRRLDTDYIDLYQCHWRDYDPSLAADLVPVLKDLVAEGKIRWYGWSTPYPERARVFAAGEHCVAIQYNYNLLERNPEMLVLCEEYNLASIARGPLAMGLLTGKFRPDSQIYQDDVRSFLWDLQQGKEAKQLEMLQAIREILTQDGRTLPQAALGWLWARGTQIIPITGFRTVKQVEENVGALEFGPLSSEQMREIDRVLGKYVDLDALNLLD